MKEPEAVVRMHQAIVDKIAAIPGVTSVGLTSIVPMTDRGWHDPIFAEDQTYEQGQLPPIRAVQVRLARPAEDDGQPARRRARLHVGRTPTTSGRS